jgi:tRNA(Ile)-lysidine synthase
MLNEMEKTITRYNMLKEGDRVVVGVSGGPDSTALLYLLDSLKKEFKLSLFVAHLNHGIRGRSAQKDAEFVDKTAEKLRLPVIIRSENIPRIAKENKLSVEEAGRSCRYEFYLAAARECRAGKIALGHTRDDQAETVLMRLIRGSGLLGLSGIPPVRKFEDKLIIRPLIDTSKAEVLKFLAKKNIPFRRDNTNASPIYMRNKIRLKLQPFLKKEFNPAIEETLAQTGRNLRLDYDYLANAADSKFRYYARTAKDSVRLKLGFLREAAAIQRMIIRECIKRAKGDLNSVTYGHWEDLNRLLEKKTAWSMTLPGRLFVRRAGNELIFSSSSKEEEADVTGCVYSLKIPGTTRIAEAGKSIEAGFVKAPPDFRLKKSRQEEYFDFERLEAPIYLRFRKAGDIIIPIGMTRPKRLKRVFVDEKVAPQERARTLLVVSGGKIIWACGVKRSDEAKITGATKRILRIKIRDNKGK